jgi:hypothetical protein
MFLVRSAFWLTIAFIAIHPSNIDFGATARAAADQAVTAGQHLVVAEILKNDCSLSPCGQAVRPVAIAASTPAPSVDLTMQDSSAISPAPFPRPRPDWMG